MEDLALVRGGPMRSLGTDVAPSPRRLIPLKRLRMINIGEWPSASTIARLLSHLSLPRKTEMYIWGNVLRDQEDIGSLLPSDTSHLLFLQNIREWFCIRQTDPTYIAFKLIAVCNGTLHTIGSFYISQITPSAVSRFPLSKVRSLTLREDATQFRRLRVSEWRAMLGLLPALRACRRISAEHESIDIISAASPTVPPIPTQCPPSQLHSRRGSMSRVKDSRNHRGARSSRLAHLHSGSRAQ
ncbi:hypothetical protein DFH07DRAFT_232408 [Mycena maculata]|uniref:Uncharacterized protein n=1 Tax=Mycena maculata TaxID=230809 RepID=A0AAD7MPS3_9AGAR|nr:hypothetical protein DFH07DRAFT_232408 [Mycena maculata]